MTTVDKHTKYKLGWGGGPVPSWRAMQYARAMVNEGKHLSAELLDLTDHIRGGYRLGKALLVYDDTHFQVFKITGDLVKVDNKTQMKAKALSQVLSINSAKLFE